MALAWDRFLWAQQAKVAMPGSVGNDKEQGLAGWMCMISEPKCKTGTHPGDVSLHLPLAWGEKAVSWHGVGVLHRFYDGDVGEEHDHHGDEKAEDEDGDDVGLVNGGVVGFGPVHLTRAVTSILGRRKNTRWWWMTEMMEM